MNFASLHNDISPAARLWRSYIQRYRRKRRACTQLPPRKPFRIRARDYLSIRAGLLWGWHSCV
jgi:hypothetical protein